MHSDFSLNNNQTIVEYDKGVVYEAQARMSCVVRVVGGAGERIRVLVHRTPPDGCWVGGRGWGVLSETIEWGLDLVGAGPCPVMDVPALRVSVRKGPLAFRVRIVRLCLCASSCTYIPCSLC